MPTDAAGDAAADAEGQCTTSVPVDSLLAHNTSAFATYDQAHFPANFGATSSIATTGTTTMAIDPSEMDRSMNPVTPGHVSNVDIHRLVPSRPDLRWFAHATPWFGFSNHIDIGLQETDAAYAGAMLEDVARRGFDGVVVNWYGSGTTTDQVTANMQAYLKAHPSLHLTLILMLDKGIANLSQSTLATQLAYISKYTNDATYEHDGGKPIVMFFGVTAAIGTTAMAAVKASHGADQVWVEQGTGALGYAFSDQVFDWAHVYTDGVHASDPYDLAAVGDFLNGVKGSSKHAFGAVMPGFNGTLTNSVAWSLGKYIPRGHGACLIQRAAKVDAMIPANVTRMQVVTWSDWEEGTQVETGIENDAAVEANVAGDMLTWQTTTGTGDESTIDHYEIYATLDGAMASPIGRVPAGTHAFALARSCAHGAGKVAVIAVGKPLIRNHGSSWVAATL